MTACKRLLANERGAVMLFGLLAAVLLTGMLAYVIGVGAAIDQHERMQDAADAAAFSAAVVEARGMNTLALINMVMAALLAILVALKLLETLAALALALCIVIAFFTGGAAAAAIGPLGDAMKVASDLHDSLRPGIHASLRALHTTARGVRTIIPSVAMARAASLVDGYHAPPAKVGIALPSRATLPVHDDEYAVLCRKAGEYTGDAVMLGLPVLPGSVKSTIRDAVGDLASGAAMWFCGGSGVAPKSTVTEKIGLPTLPERQACASVDTSARDYDAKAHQALCEHADAVEDASKPNDEGKCRKNADCTPEGPYATRATLAREACRPRKDVELRNWVYQTQEVEKTWTRPPSGGAWQLVEATPLEPTVLVAPGDKDVKTPPCGDDDASIDEGWNEERLDDDDPELVRPVCESQPNFPQGRSTQHKEVVTQVVDVFGCVEVRKRVIDVSKIVEGGPLEEVPASDTSMSPQTIDEVKLGQEPFQVRALVVGDLPANHPARVIRVAAWGRANKPKGPSARDLGRLSIAQAEHYYDTSLGSTNPSTWLWNMNWQARLRRFGWPGGTGTQSETTNAQLDWGFDPWPGGIRDACGAVAGDEVCSRSTNLVEAIGDLIVH